VEVALQQVADGALGVGPADVERDLVQLVPGQLRAAQHEADLRAVAVRDHHLEALLDEVGDVVVGLGRGERLVLDRLVGRVGDQAVAADGDHDSRAGHAVLTSSGP
jgi:hypothetical protein